MMPPETTLHDRVRDVERQLQQAGVAFGHGTTNAHDEAAWLVLHALGLPLDTDLAAPLHQALPDERLRHEKQGDVATLLRARIETRKPLAYLTHQAWLQGVPFYVDERVIIPRSLIAELLADGRIDPWLSERTQQVLDLCTGNASLAVLAALAWPEVQVTGADICADALAVAQINVAQHRLQNRIQLVQSDGLAAFLPDEAGSAASAVKPERTTPPALFDLILCNPPYVNAASMAALPPEFRAEPALALDGNAAGSADGMDFIRPLLRQAPACLSAHGVLVLEIGHERAFFEAAFPQLEAVWLETSAGDDQVLLLTREALLAA